MQKGLKYKEIIGKIRSFSSEVHPFPGIRVAMKNRVLIILCMLLADSLYAQHKVKFVVTEETAIKHDSIYITGTFNKWDSVSNINYRLKPEAGGRASITLQLPGGTHRYKYTRGNWQRVEKAFDGFERDDRIISIHRDTVIYDKVFSWRDKILLDKRVALSKATSDSARGALMYSLAAVYSNFADWYNRDSAFHYISETLLLLQKIKASTGLTPRQERESTGLLIYTQGMAANLLNQFGNYSKELELRLDNLKLAEKLDEPDPILDAYYGIASTYASVQEHKKTVEYGRKMHAYLLKQENRSLYNFYEYLCQRIIAYSYLNLGQLDSALIYSDAIEHTIPWRSSADFTKSTASQIRGDVYARQGNHPMAAKAYKAALQAAHSGKAHEAGIRSFYGLARIFYAQGQIDSALHYGKQGLKFITLFRADLQASRLNTNSLLAEMSPFIAELFKTNGQPDSAYHYLVLSTSLKDSLYNLDKMKQFQNLEFNESLRAQQHEQEKQQYRSTIRMYALIAGLGLLSILAIILYRNTRQKQKAKVKIEKAYEELKATQSQLIQSEKMASLGELTAGIAHEIQNPLNFVNNFSEVSNELIDEMNAELEKGDLEEAKAIGSDIKQNLEKINHHGKRADAIVKGMLQHSRSNSGTREPVNLNLLVDEYLRLAYHGLRAKDKRFNATLETDYDENIGKVNIIGQDIGRVALNLITNAFYAVAEKEKQSGEGFEPTVSVSTKQVDDRVEVRVSDNGNGIPAHIKDKIFQPFFTTKPTGQGTGLGLSLAYDIVKAHGGELKVETQAGEGTTFAVYLPNHS